MFQQTLKTKQQQLKTMEGELQACKGATDDHQYEIEQLSARIDKLQRKFLQRVARDGFQETK